MYGTEPVEVEGVRCRSCGANTPIADARDPRCAYCGSHVAVPPEVKARAAEVERAIEAARADVERTTWKLLPDAPRFTAFVTFYQTVYLFAALYFWSREVQRGGPVALEQWGLIALALVGPALFWNMARDRHISRELARAAKLSFAQLVIERGATGMTLYVRCSSCGARIEQVKLHGLTIFCNHCRAALLAPHELVDRSLHRFYERVLALRGQLERHLTKRELIYGLLSAVYFFAPIAIYFFVAGDRATSLLSGIALGTWSAWLYWVIVIREAENTWWVALMSLPILVGPSGAVFSYIFEPR